MRQNNSQHKILSVIRANSPIGQAQVAKAVGVSIPVVMRTVDRLRELGLVREVGRGKSTGGKPPKLLEFITDSHYSVGVDLGATRIGCVVMDGGSVIARDSAPSDFAKGPDFVLERIAELVANLLSASGVDPLKLLGIGVASPGLFDLETGRLLYAPLLGWRDVDLVTPLKRRFNTAVFADNTIRVAAHGEKIFGLAKNAKNFVCVNLGYGIGAALVLGDTVFAGESGTAGEMGHTIVVPDGPECRCGKFGCLEAVASARAIARDGREAMAANPDTLLHELTGGQPEKLDAKLVFDAARQDDTAAAEIVRRAFSHLANAIAGVINLLDPELVILQGGMSQAGSPFMEILQQNIGDQKMPMAGRGTRVVVSSLGPEVTAIGAAALVIDQRLSR